MNAKLNNNRGDTMTAGLPMLAMKEIPTPHADACRITGLSKQSGRVTGYQLSDGRTVDKAGAVALARQGGIAGVGIAVRKGNEYLKSLPDGNQDNNLSSLPTVTG